MLKLFKRLTPKEIGMAIGSIVFILLQVYLDLKIPEYMSEITTYLQSPQSTVNDVLKPGTTMIGLSLFSLFSSMVVGFLSAKLAASFATQLRQDVFDKIIDFSQAEMNYFSVPSLLTRTTNDITQLTLMIAMGMQVMIKGPVTAIWAITKIADKNQHWLVLTSAAVILIMTIIAIIIFFALPKIRLVQTLIDQLNATTRSLLQGIRVVRAYNAEQYEINNFQEANIKITKMNIFVGRLMAIMSPMMTLLVGGLTLGIYWIGAYLINQANVMEKMTLFSDMIVFSSYAMQVVIGFMMMIGIFFIMPRSIVSARRLNEILDTPNSISFGNLKNSNEKGSIVFENVSFAYADGADYVLDNISFTATQGQTIAFIGSTGSGKSTLVSLIARFYNATKGRILVNGQPIQNYSHEALNNMVTYIPQKAVLFNGTIDSNVSFGTSGRLSLSLQDKEEALRLAQAWEFVFEKEDGLNSIVAQNGTNFSGGQRQRLSIARALARQTDIIIFDDSFSALDYKTDRTLRQQIKENLGNVTKLIVAQRISTIMDADKIIVLDEGKIVGEGTHQELLLNNVVYQEIAYSQLSKEELAHE